MAVRANWFGLLRCMYALHFHALIKVAPGSNIVMVYPSITVDSGCASSCHRASRDQRINDNWALLYAMECAQKTTAPVAIAFNLVNDI